MFLPNDVPTDSVLRRHATTEHHRILGLPPTDSVLRRHYEQLETASQERGQAVADAAARVLPKAATPASSAPAAVAAPPAAPTQSAPVARAAAAVPAAAPVASGGGLMGWLRRLFGG